MKKIFLLLLAISFTFIAKSQVVYGITSAFYWPSKVDLKKSGGGQDLTKLYSCIKFYTPTETLPAKIQIVSSSGEVLVSGKAHDLEKAKQIALNRGSAYTIKWDAINIYGDNLMYECGVYVEDGYDDSGIFKIHMTFVYSNGEIFFYSVHRQD